MNVAMYHLLVIAVSVFGIVTGYRRGLLRQISAVLAIAFGIVCVRMFSQELTEKLVEWLHVRIPGFNLKYVVLTLSATIVYTGVYLLTRLLTFPLAYLMKLIPTGLLNSLGGAVLGTFKYLMFVSLALNLIVDLKPGSDLLKVCCSHDGNVVAGVVEIAPSVLGFPGPEDIGHRLQLEEAKKIS